MLGWSTRTLPDLKLLHYRFTGSADGAWRDSVKSGLANYITGYHPLFMLVKCARHLTLKRHLVGSLGLSWGFLKGYYDARSSGPRSNSHRIHALSTAAKASVLESIWR